MSRLVPISKELVVGDSDLDVGLRWASQGSGFVGPNISVAATIDAKARMRTPPLNTRGESSWLRSARSHANSAQDWDRPVRWRSCWSRPFPRSTLTACVLSQDAGLSVAVEVAHSDRGPTRPRIGADQCTTDLMGPVHFPGSRPDGPRSATTYGWLASTTPRRCGQLLCSPGSAVGYPQANMACRICAEQRLPVVKSL